MPPKSAGTDSLPSMVSTVSFNTAAEAWTPWGEVRAQASVFHWRGWPFDARRWSHGTGCDAPPGSAAMMPKEQIVDGLTVPVTVVASRTEAELITGLLRSNGLRAAVSADDAGGQDPQLQLEGVRVLVAPSDEAAARQILAAAEAAGS